MKQYLSDEQVAIWIYISDNITRQLLLIAQVEEIDEILEMKVTHRKNLTRREKKFGWVAQFWQNLSIFENLRKKLYVLEVLLSRIASVSEMGKNLAGAAVIQPDASDGSAPEDPYA